MHSFGCEHEKFPAEKYTIHMFLLVTFGFFSGVCLLLFGLVFFYSILFLFRMLCILFLKPLIKQNPNWFIASLHHIFFDVYFSLRKGTYFSVHTSFFSRTSVPPVSRRLICANSIRFQFGVFLPILLAQPRHSTYFKSIRKNDSNRNHLYLYQKIRLNTSTGSGNSNEMSLNERLMWLKIRFQTENVLWLFPFTLDN